ncbi:transcription initiation factor IID, 18kD subunit-domain-containing protein [Emericellopsis atlantica]|uniref:Transcription initiation factor TFIID subunit 13 n=1 Tax=Emericellopsis atlantica TaxID=2614577 RepID=A0A9P7ZUW6_9HYPO|nr:transcription initiation factor IID, 18kD subunit-domain-containing protein [Emericellopsis atlantica]KAG9258093.1 transcription initiation factor IID, 18kD subunit-domain-containing protein [Emericellopsis atlantica]
MEPRARAAKNVGKMNFSVNDLSMILFAHGDVREPLPETVRVFDEILTDFMQSIAFEAARAAQYSGRQKIKYEDFEFAFRKNPTFLGKVQETFEKSKEIKRVRDIMQTDESALAKEVAEEEKAQARNAGKSKAADEELGEADDDADAQMDAVGKKR